MNIAAAINAAREVLARSGINDSRREAASLLAFGLTQPAAFIIAHPEYELTAREIEWFNNSVERRSNREPFQYIVGQQEFYRLDFGVSPDVLIPRPETEILVEEAIGVLQKMHAPRFCEIGVGSGCISIAILHNVLNATAICTDISQKALGVARRNAAKHRVEDRIRFIEGDVFGGISERFDVVVSNPPYVPDGDVPGLQPEVVVYEPHNALAGGPDGLDIVRRIVDDSPDRLASHGVLFIEIGFGQSDAVARLLDPNIWQPPVFSPDLQDVPRVLKARIRSRN